MSAHNTSVAPFTIDRLLRFGDCDPSGIAYFPSYLNLLNSVVEDFWSSLGFPMHKFIVDRAMGTPTVQLDCRFTRPTQFGELLHFELKVVSVGRSSLQLEHLISVAGEAKWSAKQVIVCTSLREHCAMPWPDDMRAALQRHCVAPPAEAKTN